MLITHASSDAVLPAVALTAAILTASIADTKPCCSAIACGAQARPDGCVLHVRAPSARVLRAEAAPTRLTHCAKTRGCSAHGVGRRACSAFDRSFAALAPEAFVEQGCSQNAQGSLDS